MPALSQSATVIPAPVVWPACVGPSGSTGISEENAARIRQVVASLRVVVRRLGRINQATGRPGIARVGLRRRRASSSVDAPPASSNGG